jgi:hypothetical protein
MAQTCVLGPVGPIRHPKGLPESAQTGPTKGVGLTTMSPAEGFRPELARSTLYRVPTSRLSSVGAAGLQQSRVCGGLWIGGRTVCEGTAAVREGGRYTLPQSRNRETPNPMERGPKKRGRIGPWGRAGCSLFPPIAVPCRAGDVSRRHSSGSSPSSKQRVAGSSPARSAASRGSSARLSGSARLE